MFTVPTTNRTFTTLGILNYRAKTVRTDGLTYTSNDATLYPATRTTTYKLWNTTANFRVLKKQKALPVHNYTLQRVTYNYRHGNSLYRTFDGLWRTTTINTGYFNSTPVAAPGSDPSTISSLDAQATTKVLGEIKDMKTNVAQMIAEREQTMSLIASTAIRFAKMYTSVKRGDIKGAIGAAGMSYSRGKRRSHRGGAAKLASQYWLELQYGWKPLLSDIYGLAETAGQRKAGDLRADAKSAVSKTVEYSNVVPGIQDTFYETVRGIYTVKYKLFYGTPNINTHLAAQLGLTNPALLAWELLPYSFVVDWFLPIGGWINTLDATTGLDFIKGSKTVVYNASLNRTVIRTRNPSSPPSVEADIGFFQEGGSFLEITRTKLVDFPSARFPRFKSPISPVHAANALALLTLAFKSSR